MAAGIDLDIHLIGIVAGDPEAFALWVAGAEPRLRDSLRPLCARVDVEAILQETLLRIWQVAPKFCSDGNPDGLLRLAIRVGRNLSIDELRRSSHGAQSVGTELLENEPDLQAPQPGDPLLRKVIALCKEKLGGKPAQVFAARLEQGGCNSDEALAASLGMRLNTFLQNVGRARRALTHCLEKNGVDASLFGGLQ